MATTVAALVLVIGGLFLTASSAHAQDVALSVTATSTTASGTSNWTMSFTAPGAISSGTRIDYYMPADWSGSEPEYFNISSATLTSGSGTLEKEAAYGYMTITTSSAYSSGDTVSFTVSNIRNVSTEGTYQLYGGYSDSSFNWQNLSSNSIVVGTIALSGTVVNPDDGNSGVQGVNVDLWCNSSGKFAYTSTDSEGEFSLAGSFGNSTCELSFSYWGDLALEAPARQQITFSNGTYSGDTTFEMLTPNVSSTLELPDGTAVAFAWGWVYSDDWSYYNWFETGSDGSISLALPESGTYFMEFDISGTQYSGEYVAPSRIEFTYNADTETTSGLEDTITLSAPNVSVSVLKPDGTAAPQWTSVFVYNSNYSVWQWGFTNADGEVGFSLDSGSYIAEVDWIGYDESDTDASYVKPSPKTFSAPGDVELQLQTANNTIKAKTVNADGQGVQVYYYGWQNNGGDYFWGTSSSNGTISQKVGQGKYNIHFEEASFENRTLYFTDTYKAKFANNTGTTKDLGTLTGVRANSTINVTVYASEECGGGLLTSGAGAGVFNESVWAWNEVSSGTASLKVPKGTYQLEVFAHGTDCDQGPPGSQLVTVGANSSKTIEVTLLDRNATLSGKVVDASGSGLGCQWVWGYKEGFGDWINTETDQDGTFEVKAIPGKWYFEAHPSGINSDDCTDEGSDASGGYYDDGGSSGGDTGGFSTSNVATGGDQASAQGKGIQYVYIGGARKVTAVANSTTQISNFQFLVADATLSGRVRYGDGHADEGDILSGIDGFVTITTGGGGSNADLYGSALWGWIDNGQFSIDVPASPSDGYQLVAFLDPFADYTVVGTGSYEGSTISTGTIDVESGEEVDTAAVYVLPNDATISGEITGNLSTAGFFAEVFADNGSFGYASTFAEGGEYELDIASGAGPWTVNFHIPEGFGAFALPASDNTVDLDSGDTATVNFEIVEADSTIEGEVVNPDGDAVDGATIVIASDQISTKTTTDEDGSYEVDVPDDDYAVYVALDDDEDLLNPKSKKLSTEEDETTEANFTAIEPNATISGTVDVDGSEAEDALITAWNDDGMVAYGETDSDGNYTIDAYFEEGGTDWSIRTTYDDEDESEALDSGVSTMTVDAEEETNDVELTTDSSQASFSTSSRTITANTDTLPAKQRKQFTSSTQQVFRFSDNASFRLPAYSTSSSEETMTGIITPTSEVPSTTTHQVLSYAYEAQALDSNNSEVGKFSGSATVTLPYTTTQLDAFGVDSGDITMGVYDGVTWRDVSGAIVNTDTKTVSANVTGFGTFAVTTSVRSAAASDVSGSKLKRPKNFRIVKKSRKAKGFTAKWKKNNNADSYEVQVWDGKKRVRNRTLLKTYTSSKAKKKIKKRKANTVFYVRVRGVRDGLGGNWSTYKKVRTLPQSPKKLKIRRKQVLDTGVGQFSLRFNQQKVRKKLRAVVQIVNADNEKIPFTVGKKTQAKKKGVYKLKKKRALQKKKIRVASEYVGIPLRVKVRTTRRKKPKNNRSPFVQSSLFIIE